MTIVVGHPTRTHDRSAVSLGAMLARSLSTDLLVVSVVPAQWPTLVAGNVDREYAAWAHEVGAAAVADAERVLAEVAGDLEARAVAVPGRSVPAALLEQARSVDAGLVVVGSAADGPWERVALGSTADHLLHSAHVPVAVAPRGFATHAVPRFTRATCAFRADRASAEVLRRTTEICASAGAAVRIATFGVLGKTMYPPEVRGEQDVLASFVEQAEAALREAAAATGLREVDHVVATGPDWASAVGRLEWRHDDVLVLGSSPRGVLARVFIGSHASRIIRHSPVPVVVVPES
ncbi:universal stress protein [Nocardioides conyzicola]|uniref:Universal stress protein n=1 Tax=Nocardioides conyzicola TaxID=1651781 RepID=A0ABP8XHW7_9ACTN